MGDALAYPFQHAFLNCWTTSYVPASTTSLVIPDNKCNEVTIVSFDLTMYTHLETLVVGKNCYRNVEVFNITGLDSLRSIVINDYSFYSASFYSMGCVRGRR